MILQPESLYSIQCESGKSLFPDPNSYKDFLTQFNEELASISTLWAFSLYPQGIQLLVKTTGETDWENYLRKNNLIKKDFQVFEEAGGMLVMATLIQNKISGFFRSYTLGGKLNITPVTENDLGNSISAIHLAPVKLGLVANPAEWTFSSYNAFLSDKPTKLPRIEVLEILGGADSFITLHQ